MGTYLQIKVIPAKAGIQGLESCKLVLRNSLFLYNKKATSLDSGSSPE
jgi:hypothetical protein